MISVYCYGLHWANGTVPFLLQRTGTQNLIDLELECPFAVASMRPKIQCPHDINLSAAVATPEWVQDPLAQAMLPLPRPVDDKTKIIIDKDGKIVSLVSQLMRLNTPTMNLIRPIWWMEGIQSTYAYRMTNLGPVVWTNLLPQNCRLAKRHMDFAVANQRRLLLVASEPVPVFGPTIEYIETDLSQIEHEPLEAIGAGVLKDFMHAGSS